MMLLQAVGCRQLCTTKVSWCIRAHVLFTLGEGQKVYSSIWFLKIWRGVVDLAPTLDFGPVALLTERDRGWWRGLTYRSGRKLGTSDQ